MFYVVLGFFKLGTILPKLTSCFVTYVYNKSQAVHYVSTYVCMYSHMYVVLSTIIFLQNLLCILSRKMLVM
jgi:hypothetical protein